MQLESQHDLTSSSCSSLQRHKYNFLTEDLTDNTKDIMTFTPYCCQYVWGGLTILCLYKENKLQDWKNVFTLHIPPWAPHTYDFIVLTSLTHPRKILLVVLQIGKAKDLSGPLCMATTAVKAMCKYCGRFWDAIWILIPNLSFNCMNKV
jgi:hypothetical protein